MDTSVGLATLQQQAEPSTSSAAPDYYSRVLLVTVAGLISVANDGTPITSAPCLRRGQR